MSQDSIYDGRVVRRWGCRSPTSVSSWISLLRKRPNEGAMDRSDMKRSSCKTKSGSFFTSCENWTHQNLFDS